MCYTAYKPKTFYDKLNPSVLFNFLNSNLFTDISAFEAVAQSLCCDRGSSDGNTSQGISQGLQRWNFFCYIIIFEVKAVALPTDL